MSDKIINIPITFKQRDYNSHGTGYVPCNVTDRWLQFSETFDKGTGLVFVDVMTVNNNAKPKKLCDLCLNIHDLKAELDKITPN